MTDGAVRRPGVIAVFGGTFDPPHWGHVRAAEAVRDRMGVEAVWLVPARIPPHRATPRLSPEERFQLVEAAVAGRKRLLANAVELEREGPSFTIDTLDTLAAGRGLRWDGGGPLLAVRGWVSDAFREIRTWSRYEQLLDRHPVLVHRRAGCAVAEAVTVLPRRFRARVTADLSAPLPPPRILTLDIDLPDPKSYRIRELLKQHTPVDHLVPPRVAARIAETGFLSVSDAPSNASAESCARFSAEVAQLEKAEDVVVLDLRGLAGFTDFFVIATASSERRRTTIVDAVERRVRERVGRKPIHLEGIPGGRLAAGRLRGLRRPCLLAGEPRAVSTREALGRRRPLVPGVRRPGARAAETSAFTLESGFRRPGTHRWAFAPCCS